jgi:hypothetical protein
MERDLKEIEVPDELTKQNMLDRIGRLGGNYNVFIIPKRIGEDI